MSNYIKSLDAKGCVVLGEPKYYSRFGFKEHSELKLENVPPEYFLALSFASDYPVGNVQFDRAFENVV